MTGAKHVGSFIIIGQIKFKRNGSNMSDRMLNAQWGPDIGVFRGCSGGADARGSVWAAGWRARVIASEPLTKPQLQHDILQSLTQTAYSSDTSHNKRSLAPPTLSNIKK
jgi:hypothetical protein